MRHKAVITTFIIGILTATTWLVLNASQPTQAQSTQGLIDITLQPNKASFQPGEDVFIDIIAHPNGQAITAADITITIDSTYLAPATTPFIPIDTLTTILPNCDADPAGDACPATGSATSSEARLILGAGCTDSGCTPPATDTPFTLATLHLIAQDAVGTTQLELPIQVAATSHSQDTTRYAHPLTLSFPPCGLSYDYDANGTTNIVDIMLAAANWNTTPEDFAFESRFDLNQDHAISIVDIQTIANSWNTSCN